MSTVSRPTPAWAIVTLREVMVKARDRSYLISTLVTLVLIVGVVVFNAYMSSKAEEYTVAVTGADAVSVVETAHETGQADGGNTSFEAVEASSREAAEELVRSGEADAALLVAYDGWTLTGNEELANGLQQGIAEALRAEVLEINAANAGTTPEALLEGSEFKTALLNGDAENQFVAQFTGFVFGFLFYMAAIVFGMAIATSVLEEKQNRVVEILATAIPIRQLLYGKVAGNTILAMIQLALYAGAALLALTFTGTADSVSTIIPASGWFLVFFLVGFLILASLWAMIGSMASRTEDLNNSSGPVLTVIIVALFAGLFAKGQLLVAASFVPVISTVAMPVRMLSGEIPLWETFLSLALALAAAYALLRFGEKIYRRAVMQGGGALTLRKAMKLEQ
ncbi:ABC transporter permease [Arthrobacter koreensis]|jgi:ABC-2 type transport system permease protein|uniref:ABC transporter permease n=1 Tax=Arthrobacter koreensis TaxID=199136 RepID=A0ABY6FRW9_9MICC|nr:ABC transporter permease [Arthrobacter koreensis]MDF2498829.1 transporter permease [Arthrobacter koreensis]MEB7446714.1 ABC transporter permease [Arthrobacter koreensis]UYB35782.1 ABC transporter permease [Arthrobacter koreensis]